MRGDLPILYGIDCNGIARPLLVDELGRLILSVDGCAATSTITCFSGCAIGGKAVDYAVGDRTIIIGSSISLVNPLRVFLWDRLPNLSLTGMNFLFEQNLGESFNVTFTSISHWLSVFAVNPSGGFYDGCCLSLGTGNNIVIVGFE
jgi:hypothetical protein